MRQSLISDDLLRQLIAVGQVDVIVGLPTHNNSSSVTDVVRAVHQGFGKYFARERTALINLDGGSDDGTPELVRAASPEEGVAVERQRQPRTASPRRITGYRGRGPASARCSRPPICCRQRPWRSWRLT